LFQVTAEPCDEAIGANDGREVFTLFPDGMIQSVGNKCIAATYDSKANSAPTKLGSCDLNIGGGNRWHLTKDSQLMSANGLCMVLESSPSFESNIASVTATSHVDGYSPELIMDASKDRFWKSVPGQGAYESIVIDLDRPMRVRSITIEWKYISSEYEIQYASETGPWKRFARQSGNIATKSHLFGHSGIATKLRIVMKEMFGLNDAFGVTAIHVTDAPLYITAMDCERASFASEGGNILFFRYSSVYKRITSSLSSVLPLAHASIADLGIAVSQLSRVMPELSTCFSKSFLSLNVTHTKDSKLPVHIKSNVIDRISNIDSDQLDDFINTARSIVTSAESHTL